MYIDGDTHYWPLRFIDKVKHPGKGHLEVVEDKGDMVRYGEVVPGKVATYYRDGKKDSLLQRRALEHTAARRVHEERWLRQAGLDPRQPAVDLRVRSGARPPACARVQRYGGGRYPGRRSFYRLRLDLSARYSRNP